MRTLLTALAVVVAVFVVLSVVRYAPLLSVPVLLVSVPLILVVQRCRRK